MMLACTDFHENRFIDECARKFSVGTDGRKEFFCEKKKNLVLNNVINLDFYQ